MARLKKKRKVASKDDGKKIGKPSLRQRIADVDSELLELLEAEDPDIFNASDKSDEDDEAATGHDDGDSQTTTITAGMLTKMVKDFQKNQVPVKTIKRMVGVFAACVAKSGADMDHVSVRYEVNDVDVYNYCISSCFEYFPSVWPRGCGFASMEKKVTQSVTWRKLFPAIKLYLRSLVKFLSEIENEDVLCTTLEHLLSLGDYLALTSVTSKVLLKKLISIWSTKSVRSRRLAHQCILMLMSSFTEKFSEMIVKNLYMAFAKNSKLLDESSYENIDLMQSTFVAVCQANLKVAYRHAFMFIRQLAITLRSAIVSQAKNGGRSVHSWPFVQSIIMWCKVVSACPDDSLIQSLRYPLVQVAFGCARFRKSAKCFPLVIRLCHSLMDMASATKTFIPVHMIILELLSAVDFNRRPRSQTLKPVDFDCCLKLSNAQIEESSFQTLAINKIAELLLKFFYINKQSASYPELTVSVVRQLRTFCKTCRRSQFSRAIKETKDIIEQHAKWIGEQRTPDASCASLASETVAPSGQQSPLDSYFERYTKVKLRQDAIRAQIAKQEVKLTTPQPLPSTSSTNNKPRKKTSADNDDEVIDFEFSDSE